MRPRTSIWLWLALAGALLAFAGPVGAQTSETVPVIEINGTVDPATEGWLDSALEEATEEDAPLAVVRLDTPGGLESSMREMIKRIIEAPMPVVVYVAPDGARAASAGAFLTEAGDVAAMAPQTNIGSASAVTAAGGDIGGTLGRKIQNDASALIRALADEHGRNGAVAETMVTDAANFTAAEALEERLIDLVVESEDELLTELDGLRVEGPKAGTLATAGLELEEQAMPLHYAVLQFLVNPTVAYLLILVGFVGLAIELFAPGGIVPGAVGALALILGGFGALQLPVTAIGIALLLLGIGLIIAETQLPTAGLLGVGGIVALAFGGILLFDTGSEAYEVSVPAVITAAVVLGGFVVFAGAKAVQANKASPLTGWEELVGAVGTVRQPLEPVGQVFVQGALWKAMLADEAGDDDAERVRQRGARVRVESVEGLTLRVRPVEEEEEA